MATKEKIRKKAPPPAEVERPGSAHSQISVKSAEATNITDNTEKFIQDESSHEKQQELTPEKVPKHQTEIVPEKSTKTDKPAEKTADRSKKKQGNLDDERNRKNEDRNERKKFKGKKKAAVEPSPSSAADASNSHGTVHPRDPAGSTVSLRSNASTVREAWTDKSENGSQADLNPETTSQKTEEDEISDHAYIPYKYARSCIAKIMDDMKNMKITHVRIVNDIQHQYKVIEDETQSQFNTYVFFLRDQYSNKVKTFKQVIDVHRLDLQSKEEYWNEMLKSLAERNNKLLRDKKVLLIQNKVEIERLEKEKIEVTTELTHKLDTVTATLAVASAAETKVVTYEKEIQELKQENEKKNEEIRKLQERPVSAQADKGAQQEIKELQMALAIKEEELRAALAGGAVVMSTKEQKSKVVKKEDSKLLLAATVISSEEKDKMSQERGQITEERDKMMDERKEIDEERKGFQDDRKKWLDEINRLTAELTQQNKTSAELEVKNDSLKHQLQDLATLQAKYHALESQYEALSVIVQSSDASKEAAKENITKTKSEKDMMVQEQKNKETEIKKWEETFKKKHKREPKDEDKSDSVKEMYIQKEELDTMVTSLDQKLVTYEKVQQGQVPEPPEVLPVSMVIKEPEVKTVEIKVPDPVVLEELQKAQAEIARLRDQISGLHEENTNQANIISQQNEEMSNLRGRISQLETEVEALKVGSVGAVTSSVSNEEVEKLTLENRELKKDMKKMIKRMEKQKGTDKVATGDLDEHAENMEGKVLELEDKVIDLESDNKGLKEDKDKLVLEKENLMKQISALKVATSTSVAPVMAMAAGSKQDQSEGCSLAEHADLIIQLEIKNKELIDKDRLISEKDRQIEEKDNLIEEKMKEIEKLRDQCKEMRSDMMKMTKSHLKLQTKLKDLDQLEKTKKLLQAMAFYVQEIHRDLPPAGEAVKKRLDTISANVPSLKTAEEKCQKAYDAWAEQFKKKNGKDPGPKDRDAEGGKLFHVLETSKKEHEDLQIKVEALTIMQTGDYKAPLQREKTVIEEETPVKKMEQQMSALDAKLGDLESENDHLKSEKSEMTAKMRELEVQLAEARNKAELQATLAMGDMNTEELSNQITSLQKEVSLAEAALRQEKMAHNSTKEELENLRNQMSVIKEDVDNQKLELQTKMSNEKKLMDAELKAKDQEITKLTSRNDELEKARLANVPLDTAKEIQNLQAKLALLEKDKNKSGTETTALEGQISELKVKLENANKNLEAQRAASRETEAKLKNAKTEKDKAIREATSQMEKKEQQRINEDKKRISALERKIKELETAKPVGKGVAAVPGLGPSDATTQNLKTQIVNLKKENTEANAKLKQLEAELKKGGRPGTAAASEDKNLQKRHEKILKELEKKYEIEKNRTEKLQESLKGTEDDLKETKKDRDDKANELKKLEAELSALGIAAKQGVEAAMKVKGLETENKKLLEENKVLTENYNSERVLRKKYYNMVEDMKGKIRVYCRARPMSSSELGRGNYSVCKSQDEYSITVETQRGIKDFQFDQVFMEDSTQEKIFEDTNNLIQSAVDGYNVCIFAYGQTGSGKTFTMIGDKEQNFPGIAPRAFNRIFELIHELRSKYEINVTAYMLELYNDRLIDLFAKPGMSSDDKMEVKVDKKGLVWVKGAVIKEAHNSKELFALFDEGSKNRHTASTKMNADSSRSHLIISIVMESTNKTTGQSIKGKLSLVDLAGSERVGKTGASAEQLKEAMSINKSLSALGDVISALSSEQQFIPYRNNKLTMLMQDSLGGNAKTLMFVNVSPADYNQDESVISLTYASRVKLITNQASKNSDNKEIARLKSIIAKLKAGEKVEEEEAA